MGEVKRAATLVEVGVTQLWRIDLMTDQAMRKGWFALPTWHKSLITLMQSVLSKMGRLSSTMISFK